MFVEWHGVTRCRMGDVRHVFLESVLGRLNRVYAVGKKVVIDRKVNILHRLSVFISLLTTLCDATSARESELGNGPPALDEPNYPVLTKHRQVCYAVSESTNTCSDGSVSRSLLSIH